jgi:hypothetical protein
MNFLGSVLGFNSPKPSNSNISVEENLVNDKVPVNIEVDDVSLKIIDNEEIRVEIDEKSMLSTLETHLDHHDSNSVIKPYENSIDVSQFFSPGTLDFDFKNPTWEPVDLSCSFKPVVFEPSFMNFQPIPIETTTCTLNNESTKLKKKKKKKKPQLL